MNEYCKCNEADPAREEGKCMGHCNFAWVINAHTSKKRTVVWSHCNLRLDLDFNLSEDKS